MMVSYEDMILENTIETDVLMNPQKKHFQKVALFGRRVEGIEETLLAIKAYLSNYPVEVVLEPSTAELLPDSRLTVLPQTLLCKNCDLLIVVGGDGSMLNAAHMAADYGLPVLGINRGRLGFLTDIKPDELDKIDDVLSGNFIEEERFLLEATVNHLNGDVSHAIALNDVVLLPGNLAHMIEFQVKINDQMICYQRADGIIIATPTGSTAYALSGGGPILHPGLDAIVLVPMFPHTLSSRPIVVKSNSAIDIHLSANNQAPSRVSCDGQERIILEPGEKITICRKAETLRLIHPLDYNYFETLRKKLGWEG